MGYGEIAQLTVIYIITSNQKAPEVRSLVAKARLSAIIFCVIKYGYLGWWVRVRETISGGGWTAKRRQIEWCIDGLCLCFTISEKRVISTICSTTINNNR